MILFPILWRNPWKILQNKRRSLLETIVGFITDESKNSMMISRVLNLNIKPDKPLLFNYIGFCRHLNLYKLERTIYTIQNIKEVKWSIIRNEIFKLFLNRNNRFTHDSIWIKHHIPSSRI